MSESLRKCRKTRRKINLCCASSVLKKPSRLPAKGSIAVFCFLIKCTVGTNSNMCLACDRPAVGLQHENLNTYTAQHWGDKRSYVLWAAGVSLTTPLRCMKHYNFLETLEGSGAEILTTTSNCSPPPTNRGSWIWKPTSVLICISCTSSLVC